MGVALDSLVIIVEYAGIVAIVLLLYSLFTRHLDNSGTLGFFQRKFLLLPAIGFLVTILIVTNLGITPMSEYQGLNSERSYNVDTGFETDFTIREQYMYSGYLRVSIRENLYFDESGHVEVSVFQNDTLVDTASLDFQFIGEEPSEPYENYMASAQCDIVLEPGTYNVQVNFTKYSEGTLIDGGIDFIDLTLSQPLVAGFITEVVDWSSYQFILNVSSVLLLLVGICVDSPNKKTLKEDETDWRSMSQYEY
ncbi:MAG: hypothetical protein ACTSWA_07490 [Candidatus Thorarchaeota archaeon]